MEMNLYEKRIFDFNIHLPMGNDGLDQRHLEDLSMQLPQLGEALSFYKDDLKTLSGANYMLFNQHILENPNFLEDFDRIKNNDHIQKHFHFTLLLDFRHPNVLKHLSDAAKAGIKGIKFHSYIQKIEESDFSKIIYLCSKAEELKMFICLDTSFGTVNLYRYDNLRLAAKVAEVVKKTPIILLHSGGSRVLEAMLIADMQENIYLETSLTIPFYETSSLWKDLAYTYRKLGCNRVLYATDFPYITLEQSFKAHQHFFVEFGFTEDELEKILYKNANNLFSSLQA